MRNDGGNTAKSTSALDGSWEVTILFHKYVESIAIGSITFGTLIRRLFLARNKRYHKLYPVPGGICIPPPSTGLTIDPFRTEKYVYKSYNVNNNE